MVVVTFSAAFPVCLLLKRAEGRPEGKHVFSHLGLSPASVSEIITGCFYATISVPHLMREVKCML